MYRTVDDRYTLSTEGAGWLAAYSNKTEALEAAALQASDQRVTIDVFDVMARHGAVELWQVKPDGVVHKEIRP